MAVDTTSARTARAASGRGRPELVTIRRTALMAGLIEGMAIAQDAIDAGTRIVALAPNGSRQAIANEGGRIGFRGTKALDELRRLAGEVEE